METGKVTSNPARILKRRKVSNDRVRFLNQFPPLATKVEYLKPFDTEEARLRAVIEADCPEHLNGFVVC
jgi:hypothetical protein